MDSPEPTITAVYLENIDPQITEVQLLDFCQQYGNVHLLKKYTIMTAMIWYTNYIDAQSAIWKINEAIGNKTGIVARLGRRKQNPSDSDPQTPYESQPPIYLNNFDPMSTEMDVYRFCVLYDKPYNIRKCSATSALVWFSPIAEPIKTIIEKINDNNVMGIVASLGKIKRASVKTVSDKDDCRPVTTHLDTGVHLTNIDPIFTEAEIYRLCRIYGKLHTFTKTSATTATIWYKTLFETETAIRELNKGNLLGIRASLDSSSNDGPSRTTDALEVSSSDVETDRSKIAHTESHHMVRMTERRIQGPFKGPSIICENLVSPPDFSGSKNSNLINKDISERDLFMHSMSNMAKSSGGRHTKLAYTFCSIGLEELATLSDDRACVVCSLKTENKCGLCNTSFCSRICLKSSWEKHRLLCSENALPDTGNDKKIEYNKRDHQTKRLCFPMAASKSHVAITHIVNHRKVFVRSVELDAHLEYVHTLMDCAEFNKNAPCSNEPPRQNDVVLAQLGDSFQRALVLDVVSPEEIQVKFVDFGNTAVLSLNNIKPLSVELQRRPTHTTLVILDTIPIKLCNDQVLSQLNELMAEYTPLKMVFEEPLSPSSTVRLFDTVSGESINQKLFQLNHIEAVSLNERPIGMDDIEYTPLDGVDMEIVVLDNSLLSMNSVFCVRKEHLNELMSNNQRIQEYCNRVKERYTPRVHEIVLCEWQHVWYRAMCMEVNGDQMPAMQFIDYGNFQVVSIECIRKMPREFTYRRVSVECALADVREISQAALEILTGVFATGAVIHIDMAKNVESQHEEFSHIHSERIMNMLKI